MIKVNVRGGTKEQRKAVRSIARFVPTVLMSNRLAKTLTVNINLKKDLFVKEFVYGDCEVKDFERRPKNFTIRADASMKLKPLLVTIAHEMVHVKQYAREELFEGIRKGLRWQGNYVKKDLDYFDTPWEIEAHGREESLFTKWLEVCNGILFGEETGWTVDDFYPKGYWDKKYMSSDY